MRLFDRRNRLQRLLDQRPDMPSGVRPGLASVPSSKATKAGLIAVSGVAGLAAASARISSLRRRSDGATDDP